MNKALAVFSLLIILASIFFDFLPVLVLGLFLLVISLIPSRKANKQRTEAQARETQRIEEVRIQEEQVTQETQNKAQSAVSLALFPEPILNPVFPLEYKEMPAQEQKEDLAELAILLLILSLRR